MRIFLSRLPSPVGRPAIAAYAAFAGSLALTPLAAHAQYPWTGVELRSGGDVLTGGNQRWQEHEVSLSHRHTARTGFAATAGWQQRFGRDDQRGLVEGSLGIGSRLTVGADVESSPTHRIVPRTGAGLLVHLGLGKGWAIEARGQSRRYDIATANGGHVRVERYWSNYAASYAVTPIRVTGASTAVSHAARFSRFWGDRGLLMLSVSTGREAENLGANRIQVMQVKSVGAWGAIPVVPHLDLTYAGAVTRQGDLFSRTHLALGVRVVSR